MLYVPAGWIAAEKVINSEDNIGIRWLQLPENISPSFQALAYKLLPADRSQLKASSAAGFLHRIQNVILGKEPQTKSKENTSTDDPKKRQHDSNDDNSKKVRSS